MSMIILSYESWVKKAFKILFNFGMKEFKLNVFKKQRNDIWDKKFSQSVLTRKAYFEVYYLAITCTDSLAHNSLTHNSLTYLTQETGILCFPISEILAAFEWFVKNANSAFARFSGGTLASGRNTGVISPSWCIYP